MDKSPNAFRTISEVSETLDVPAHVLRFWESKFSAIKPIKRGGGRRYYRPEDVTLLFGIRELLYEDGLTIKGVQKIFRERGQRHVLSRGAEATGDALPEAAEEASEFEQNLNVAPEAADESSEVPEDEPAAAPDAERVQSVIEKLEALRARLRADPPAGGR